MLYAYNLRLLSPGYERVYYEDEFKIIETRLPYGVLGMTNCRGVIWVRKGLSWLAKKFVILHEKIHNWFPYLSEYVVRKLTHYLFPYFKTARKLTRCLSPYLKRSFHYYDYK
jgi:hypothetical protein